jgi:radical SAM/Cys-rich protein
MIDSITTFEQALERRDLRLTRSRTEIFQINVGKLCNLTCSHCHVNAGPARKGIITRETLERIVSWLENSDIKTVDLTGGAPEMIPDFRWLIEQLAKQGRRIIDRCNLTILLEHGYEDIPGVLARNHVEIVASMPCYSPENVNAQRGEGVFEASIKALQILNSHGYGTDIKLPLHLVYNPVEAKLPGPQMQLEMDYKRELWDHFKIRFNQLYTITNMPVSRYASWLKHNNQLEEYMSLLRNTFNPGTVEGLMCRNTLNVDWQGRIFDCDFNQQLGMHLHHQLPNQANGKPLYFWDIKEQELATLPILTGRHCFGCTAGSGSSCSGAVL